MILGLAVRDNLVECTCNDKAFDNFIGGAARLEHLQSKLGVVLANGITKFVAHSELGLVDPVFDECNLTLSQHWSTEL